MSGLSTLTESDWLQVNDRLQVSLMDHLFTKIEAIYPGKWKSSFQSDSAIQNWRIVWASAFEHHKITLLDVKRGLDNLPALNKNWPPQLGEFLDACKYTEREEPSHKSYALPKYNTPEQKEKGREQLEKIKAMLKSSPLLNRGME